MRVQDNLVARHERKLLDFICARLPPSVTPDRLTALGVAGAVLVLAGYASSRSEPWGLWLASLGFVVHWFGDSLDGSLARARNIERPLYGHFTDHSLDALSNTIILAGLGLSPFVRMDIALATLAGYLLLTIHVCLRDRAQGVFQLSFLFMGPTELRIILIALNGCMWLTGPVPLALSGLHATIYDGFFAAATLAFVAIFCLATRNTALALAAEERRAGPPDPRPEAG